MKMSLRNSLKTEKAKERYDRNYDSVEITFTQKELKEHDMKFANEIYDAVTKKLIDLGTDLRVNLAIQDVILDFVYK